MSLRNCFSLRRKFVIEEIECSVILKYKSNSLAVFTLEDQQIVWTDKSSQTDKSSDVKTGRTSFQTTLSSQFVRLFVRQ